MTKELTLMQFIQELRKQNISPREYKKQVDLFLDIKSRNKGIPLSGQFEITSLCNLDCKMCYVHMNKAKVLPASFWKRIMKEAHEAGMIKAVLTGGECLTHPDFEEIYLFLQSMGVEVTVMTNGILLDEQKLDFFKTHRPSMIQITLYGSNEEAYEKVTVRRMFKTVYENILRIKEADLPLRIAITPNKYMFEDFKALLTLVEELNLPYKINNSLVSPREETGRDTEDLSLDQYVELHKIRSAMHNIHLEQEDVLEIPETSNTSQKGLPCGGGRSGFHITYDGKMAPCSDLLFLGEDLHKISFTEAWVRINKEANNFPLPQECLICPYVEHCQMCPALHYDPNNPGHKNRKVCQRTIRFVQEGLIKL
ncbi:MAG: radical SAM protein [Bacillota bacterium]|nr:radical SAM protein [Bacillota bacterium]